MSDNLDSLFYSTKPLSLAPVERVIMTAMIQALKPDIALEIGSERGGTTRLLAGHAQEVICFDIDKRVERILRDVPNIRTVIGDSKQTLSRELDRIQATGGHAGFVFIDGDHSAEGVYADLKAVLTSSAAQNAVILVHDCAMEGSRQGFLKACHDYSDNLCAYDVDFSQGLAGDPDRIADSRCGGLGLILRAAPQSISALFANHERATFATLANQMGYGERLPLLKQCWRRIVPKSFRDRLYHLRQQSRI